MIDLIVIGGGHAGIEAANIANKLGLKILLITNNILNIGKISCNPSIGGIGKGVIVREIDVFEGMMSKITDLSSLGGIILNKSKGLAVKSTRIQIDKNLYNINAIQILKKNNIKIIEDEVLKILIKNNKIIGVETYNNIYKCKYIILCNGTFINSKIYIGNKEILKNRDGVKNNKYLFKQLKKIIPGYGTFKTGTPPKIKKNSILYNNIIKQQNDIVIPFHWENKINKYLKNVNCFLTNTNINTQKIILENLKKSPFYIGKLNSIGPRYCLSLEDKILKFSSKKHRVILERESLSSNEIYPNGIPMSFSYQIQKKILHSIKGLKNSKIIKPGYCIEYGYFNPIFLKKSLESKYINGLFLAGQINGTSGYEEAACQGLIASINVYMKIKNKEKFIIDKKDSYIGLLINDITSKGIDEPYRMFTNRSLNNLYLREDNCDFRLKKYLKKISFYKKKVEYINMKKKNIIKKNYFNYNKELVKNIIDSDKYIPLIKKNKTRFNNIRNINIPRNINLNRINGISNEIKFKYQILKPKKIKDLIKIPGINPFSILNIFNYIKKKY
ncbi:FAD-dependent oxidoreductase [Candidatus Vidania fulgoroideorum]